MDHVDGVVTVTERPPAPTCASNRSSGVVNSPRVRTPSHSSTHGFGIGSSVVKRKYVSTPYGGEIVTVECVSAISRGGATPFSSGKRFSTEPSRGNSNWLRPKLSMVKT